jgi:hypothetical protein
MNELNLEQQPIGKRYLAIPPQPVSYDTPNYAVGKFTELHNKLSELAPDEIKAIADHPEKIFAQYKQLMANPEFNRQYKNFRARLAAWQMDDGLKWATDNFKAMEANVPEDNPKRVDFTRQGLDTLKIMLNEWNDMNKMDLPLEMKGKISDLIPLANKLALEKAAAIEFPELQLSLKQITNIADANLFKNRIDDYIRAISGKLDAIRKDPTQIDKLRKYNKILQAAFFEKDAHG